MTTQTARFTRSRPFTSARATFADPLYRSAFSLMANTAITSLLGVVFWIVAARLYPSTVVGRDSALISTMMGISVICQLNMNNAFARFLPVTRGSTARVVALTYVLTAAVSLAAAVGFVALVARVAPALRTLGSDRALAGAFCLALPLWAVFTLQDSALTALRNAPWVVVENSVFGILKVGALIALFAVGVRDGVFVSWTVPVILITIVVNILLFRRLIPAHEQTRVRTPTDSVMARPALVRFLACDYLAWVLNNGIERLMPLVVVALVGSRGNAYFFIAFTISTAVDMLLFNVSTSLTVEGAMAEDRLAALTRGLIRRLFWLFVAGATFLTVAAPLVLLPFGRSYATAASGILRLLALSSLFRATIILYTTIARVRGRGGSILAANVALAALLVGATTAFGHRYGLTGVGLGWLTAHAIVALALLPSMRRLLRAPTAPTRPGTEERAMSFGERLVPESGEQARTDHANLDRLSPRVAGMLRVGGVYRLPASTRRADRARELEGVDPAVDVAARVLSRSIVAAANGAAPDLSRALREQVVYSGIVQGYDIARLTLGTLHCPLWYTTRPEDARAAAARLVLTAQARGFGMLMDCAGTSVREAVAGTDEHRGGDAARGRFSALILLSRMRGFQLGVAEEEAFGHARRRVRSRTYG